MARHYVRKTFPDGSTALDRMTPAQFKREGEMAGFAHFPRLAIITRNEAANGTFDAIHGGARNG